MNAQPDPANPFEYRSSSGRVLQTCDVYDRLEKLKGFGISDLEKVVVLPGTQKTVVLAAENGQRDCPTRERRIRNLRKRGEG